MSRSFISALCAVALTFSANVALAQVKDKTFKDWTVYSTDIDGKKVCYIASFPSDKTGNYTLRDDPYMLVTLVNKDTAEVSVSSGYRYKANSRVRVVVNDDATYYLSLVEDERAWAKDGETDQKLVNLMKAKNTLSVRGTSTKGTYSLDRYSLSGFTSAFNRMKELCK